MSRDPDDARYHPGRAGRCSRRFAPYIAGIESGRANPSLEVVERIGSALGLEMQLIGRPPAVMNSPGQRDAVHARCSGYVDRRLMSLGWQTRGEVTIVRGRIRGWIDLLAYDPRRRILLVVEIKAWIDDLGSVERQLDWYVREAPAIGRELGWRPQRVVGWVLALATADIDETMRRNRDVIDRAFPGRARDLRGVLADRDPDPPSRGIALIDPRNRRRTWLIASRADGRRSVAPYRDSGEAARLMSSRGTNTR